MILTLQTAPTVEPVSSAEAKAHLRVTSSDDDTLIGTLITTAREYVERITNRALITQTWDWYFSDFKGSEFVVPYAPLQSVTHVKYYDTSGTLQTWGSANYVVDTDSWQGRIYPIYNGTWPTDSRGYEKDVTIRFVAGYGNAGSDVPNPLKHAILMLIGELYENREMTLVGVNITELPFAVRHLLAPYAIKVF